MKWWITLFLGVMCVSSLFAQNVAMIEYVCPISNSGQEVSISHNPISKVDLKLNRSMIIGRDLLISAGAVTVAGAALYGAAWGLMGETGPAASVCSVTGISLMGISVPLYIAGSVLYVKGKKTMLQPTACGFKFLF